MASLINLKRRIKVAKNIAKTTRAMQMVAASKMRRAQEAAVRGKPYAEKLNTVVKNLIGRISEDYKHPFFTKSKGRNLVVVFSPDKGLCGSLTSNLKRELLNFDNPKDQLFITVGKKMTRAVQGEIIADFPMGVAQPTFEKIPPLARTIAEGFIKNDWSEVYLLYAKFLNLFSQKATFEKLLPVEIEREESSAPSYLFEPSALPVLKSLMPHYLESRLYQLLLETYASEQAARMIAMQNATDNAHEIIDFLTLEYNKVRQENITNEILDITRATHAILEV